ncbi:hypothetical protein HPB50_017725 [Hyalomma asiaticum]|uniref:Uncharacterized protein n=1 Tax=Hyalomma asiaticum TaxID=266040 RepID=A0ACB7SXK2_HYAAI|nr:hypothetical protein HPB50_017725 [Hyalomma asiaticum]
MDLSKLPKPDLILMCKELGVNIAQISRKPQIVQAIEAIGAEEDELRECWELIESNKKKEVEEKELKRQASEPMVLSLLRVLGNYRGYGTEDLAQLNSFQGCKEVSC